MEEEDDDGGAGDDLGAPEQEENSTPCPLCGDVYRCASAAKEGGREQASDVF